MVRVMVIIVITSVTRTVRDVPWTTLKAKCSKVVKEWLHTTISSVRYVDYSVGSGRRTNRPLAGQWWYSPPSLSHPSLDSLDSLVQLANKTEIPWLLYRDRSTNPFCSETRFVHPRLVTLD